MYLESMRLGDHCESSVSNEDVIVIRVSLGSCFISRLRLASTGDEPRGHYFWDIRKWLAVVVRRGGQLGPY